MSAAPPEVRTVDYHTGGEPFRIVTAGVPEIPGVTVLDRRAAAAAPEVDRVRRLLCHEPRGHADMYGCFLVPPDDAGAHLGVLFWHKDGYSTACGHGTIALGVHAVETGLVAGDPDGDTDVVVDVPSGRVTARVRSAGGVIASVTFRNVPSHVVARNVPVTVAHRGAAVEAAVDVAYGGAIYASVPAAAFGLAVEPRHLTELIALGRAVKAALAGHPAARHPSDDRLSGIYGVIFHEDVAPGHQRNVTVFADGEVDRSPCGSGTAARLALLHADGFTGELTHESIVGSVFTGRVAEARGDAVIPEITGMAYRTGAHAFTLDPRDPLGAGFTLR
ncbi:trans-3-hydroxy-L-proline dehydratase [Sphaerisporangium krabiense]|uniref:Proline racemase n=1 Tax=Sphaerisporangium krabiense TaxID=763782 RepID=A0A7W9DTN3_9ACTN|nr:proline racemase family protein [Sphaerisporangium krabiense]MBB5631012.1 proline racemase [Sphaerisporangium krabiense]GII65894.1 trans-3-hydroxy-L-proline dehydratase [Sphaerisporangium krabiense]